LQVCRDMQLKISAQKFEQTLINFLVDYISEERIQDTFNTQ